MTVEKVSSTAAKNRLNALLADVERTGKTLIITNHGRDVARLVPATPRPRQFGQLPNPSIPTDFDEPLPETELARWEGHLPIDSDDAILDAALTPTLKA